MSTGATDVCTFSISRIVIVGKVTLFGGKKVFGEKGIWFFGEKSHSVKKPFVYFDSGKGTGIAYMRDVCLSRKDA